MHTRGYFTVLVLVFTGVFFMLLSALSGYIFVEKKVELAKENRSKAFQIAEAGLEYYRWHLAHWPNDLKDGTNSNGPYVHTINDPEAGLLGTFSLSMSAGQYCGQTNTVDITSTGYTAADPTYKRVITARYAKPTVAKFSTITNSNVWVGSDRVINGPYHSNGGIRMDGTHNADVTSAVTTWSCTSSFGCSPTSNKDGVFGAGGPQNLWKFPAPTMDFNGFTVDLAKLKGYATSTGTYVAASGGYGWHVTLRADGQMELRKVVGAPLQWGYSIENGWQQERVVMSNVQNETVSIILPACPVIFVEDNIWLDGVVSDKVVVVAADVTQANVDRSVLINGNITKANATSGLTVIGEKDVLIGLEVPNVMTIEGVFIAQKGKFGRNHYCENECDSSHQGNEGLPGSLDEYVKRSLLTLNGTVVSNGRIGTKWTSGSTYLSGFATRYDNFDRLLSESPPPFTPAISDDYEFVRWSDTK